MPSRLRDSAASAVHPGSLDVDGNLPKAGGSLEGRFTVAERGGLVCLVRFRAYPTVIVTSAQVNRLRGLEGI